MSMFNWISPLVRRLSCFFPCQLCGIGAQHYSGICHDCWQQLPWAKQQICKQTLLFYAACHYDYPINRIIQQFKYQQQLHFQHLLAGLILSLTLPKVQAIVPMPISRQRLVSRGYNQMLIIAKIVAQALNIPVWQPIIRIDQHAQKGLSRLERLEHIQTQFIATPCHSFIYRRILILDDVVTTGSSMLALQHSLTTLGCEKIYPCCIAYAQPRSYSN